MAVLFPYSGRSLSLSLSACVCEWEISSVCVCKGECVCVCVIESLCVRVWGCVCVSVFVVCVFVRDSMWNNLRFARMRTVSALIHREGMYAYTCVWGRERNGVVSRPLMAVCEFSSRHSTQPRDFNADRTKTDGIPRGVWLNSRGVRDTTANPSLPRKRNFSGFDWKKKCLLNELASWKRTHGWLLFPNMDNPNSRIIRSHLKLHSYLNNACLTAKFECQLILKKITFFFFFQLSRRHLQTAFLFADGKK